MRKSNFALRLQPSLYEAARELAKTEGVAMNQLINVAVAQFVAANDAGNYIALRAKRGSVERALEILREAGKGNPPMPGDELPDWWKPETTAKPGSRPRGGKSTRSKSPK